MKFPKNWTKIESETSQMVAENKETIKRLKHVLTLSDSELTDFLQFSSDFFGMPKSLDDYRQTTLEHITSCEKWIAEHK